MAFCASLLGLALLVTCIVSQAPERSTQVTLLAQNSAARACTVQSFSSRNSRLHMASNSKRWCVHPLVAESAYRVTVQVRAKVRRGHGQPVRLGALVARSGRWSVYGTTQAVSATRSWKRISWVVPRVQQPGLRASVGAASRGRALILVRVIAMSAMNTDAKPVLPARVASTLPRRVAAAYWTNWGKDTPLDGLPSNINVIFASFAFGDGSGTGRVVFHPDDGSGVSTTEFLRQVRRARAKGRRVLLSIGGANDLGIRLLTGADAEAMIASVTDIVERYGFDGIDWDLENTSRFTVNNLLACSKAWKKQFGAAFAVTASPSPAAKPYKVFAQRAGNLLDYIAPQYYGYADSNRLAGMKSRTAELIRDYAVASSKVGVGVKIGSDDTTASAIFWRDAVASLRSQFPELAGASVWDATSERLRDNPFARTVAPAATRP